MDIEDINKNAIYRTKLIQLGWIEHRNSLYYKSPYHRQMYFSFPGAISIERYRYKIKQQQLKENQTSD